MKKSFALFIISVFICNCSVFASDTINSEQKEIHLDLNTGFREYKIKQPEENNDDRARKEMEEDEMPFEMVTSPLQLLKQYNAGQY